MELQAEVLGSVRVRANGDVVDLGGPRQRRLLSILLVERDAVVSTDRLIEVVFEGEPTDAARDTFRTYVARLRRALNAVGADGSSVILTIPPGHLLDSSSLTIDAVSFEEHLRDARDRLTIGDADGALLRVDEALALWRGPAYSEFADEEWAQPEAIRLEELRLLAREIRAEALIESGRHDAAIPHIEELIALEPLRENPRRLLMLALYRSGRHAEALRRGRDFNSYLAEETGLEPTSELIELERMIIDRDPRLDAKPRGRRLRGYVLGEPIGESPLGVVFRATQPSIGRDVAITVVPAEQADDPVFVRHFEIHAQQVAAIEHPNVVPLYDYWREPGGAYLVTRYLSGGSLETRLSGPDPLTVDGIESIVRDVGAALSAAHGQGVVHGQLQPKNVLFDEAGSAYLTEFAVDADVRAIPGDIEALARVTMTLWDRVSPPPDDSAGAAVKVATEVESVLQRARGADGMLGFSSVREFVDAFCTATSGDRAPTGASPVRTDAGAGIEGPNPYRGLYAFDEIDADVFFGREALEKELVAALARDPFLALVGPSGSGKSSVVRAGLLPRLRATGAFVATMVPGSRPIAELEMALSRVASSTVPDLGDHLEADPGGLGRVVRRILPDGVGPLFLVIDQFEELFTLSDPHERDIVLASLRHCLDESDNSLRVVVAARADLLGRILDHRVIGDQVRDHTRLVTPLTASELHEAVIAPAEQAGVAVEPALATALVADALGAPGSLPLLQYALTELYEHREDGTMTHAAYERLGGLAAVLAQRAEEIYGNLAVKDQEACQRLFTRLVAPGETTESTRRRARRSEVESVPTRVLDRFGAARLVSFDRHPQTREPTIEVAHEALIREWPRLRSWIERDRDGLRTLRAITAAAEEWEAADRDPGMLFRGSRLDLAGEWEDEHDAGELSPTERAFLEASHGAREAEQARERRHARRLRALTAGLAVLALIASIVGVVAVRESRIADENAAEAERRALENRVAQLVSESALARTSTDPDLAILLALAAHEASTELGGEVQPGVIEALHDSVQASRLERVIPAGIYELGISPDGRFVALDHTDSLSRLGIYEIDTGEFVRERTMEDAIGGLAYSPDGSMLAVTFIDRVRGRGPDGPALLIVDPTTLDTIHELDGGLDTWSPTWSADGRSVLAMDGTGGARVWNVDDPEPAMTFDGVAAAMFIPGTNSLATVADGRLDIIDRDSGDLLRTHEAPEIVTRLQFSPDGTTAAFADRESRVVHLVDLEGDEPPTEIPNLSPMELHFSPDGRTLSIGGNADTVQIVDLDSGEVVDLRGHGTGSWGHARTPAGDKLLAVSLEGFTRVWNTEPAGPAELGNLGLDGRVVGDKVAFDSSILLSIQTGPDTTGMDLVDTTTATVRRVADFWFASFRWPVSSPDGSLVAGISPTDHVASVIDVASGATVLRLRACETPVAVDARNRWVLVETAGCADPSQSARDAGARRGYVDLDDGELIEAISGPDVIYGATVGPPGTPAEDLLVSLWGSRVVFQRASTAETLTAWSIPSDIVVLTTAFSPDGTAVGAGAQTREGIVFDVEAILAGAAAEDAMTLFEEMHSGPTQWVVPLGDQLVTYGGGAQIQLWDTAAGSVRFEIASNPGGFGQLVAMPDGATVFYNDADGVLRRLLVDTDDLVALARSRAQRVFTETECERYFPDGGCPT